MEEFYIHLLNYLLYIHLSILHMQQNLQSLIKQFHMIFIHINQITIHILEQYHIHNYFIIYDHYKLKEYPYILIHYQLIYNLIYKLNNLMPLLLLFMPLNIIYRHIYFHPNHNKHQIIFQYMMLKINMLHNLIPLSYIHIQNLKLYMYSYNHYNH